MNGKQLKAFIDSQELKQYEFAAMLGVATETVSRWVNGKASIPTTVERYVAARIELATLNQRLRKLINAQ